MSKGHSYRGTGCKDVQGSVDSNEEAWKHPAWRQETHQMHDGTCVNSRAAATEDAAQTDKKTPPRYDHGTATGYRTRQGRMRFL